MASDLPPSNSNGLEDLTIGNKSTEVPSIQPQTNQSGDTLISHVTPHTIPGAVTKPGPTIEDLPNELLVNIFSHLDIEPPSYSHTTLHDEPTLEVTSSEVQDLKNCSLISKRWRQATLRLLFKHTRYILRYSEDDYRPILNDLTGPFRQFIRRESFADIVSSFTLVVREKTISNRHDGRPRLCEFDGFWKRLFNTIDPSTVLIAAPVEALASLTSSTINDVDSWVFDIECHYLRLQRPESKELVLTEIEVLPEESGPTRFDPSVPGTPQNPDHTFDDRLHYAGPLGSFCAKSSEFFQIRSWTSLLLNEGSNLNAFKTDRWWELETPSILRNLVGTQSGTLPLINPGIRSMRYIAIFPITAQFECLAQGLPRLDHLYCQLVPRNDALEDEELMKKIDVDDLWMERNNCYAQLMREMFNNPPEGNYRYLKTFESGDAADTDAWHMAVEFVKRAGGGWKITGDGVFERDTGIEESSSDAPNASPFPDELYRWAWNGLTNVPVSPDTGNKVSRRSQIIGTTNIILGGKTVIQAEVIIRGDLLRTLPPSTQGEKAGNAVAVAIGRTFSYFPLKIGDHVFVGPGSIIEAAMLGNHVNIGANVVVGKFVIVKDFVKILEGTVVPPNMVIPSFSVVGGCPGRVVGRWRRGRLRGWI
ncbi:putative f-box domain-containing protein [Botrytis fragariae]|uniref:Dynactin subunit 5 n=1 Tax=Botrytis fragariae TaxID=1964551 RepID=A0A8H6AW51_9HELO|nr:putative f-box domain-containing protein [Botrytis fragariae]KAF5874811.1 putative f-box domain-containing protein [Botrytis fragariae]